jgi:arginine repressor
MKDEKLHEHGIQKRISSLLKRRSLVGITNSRIIKLDRGIIGGFTITDFQWKNLIDAHLSENILSSILGSNLVFEYQLERKKDKRARNKAADENYEAPIDVMRLISIPTENAAKIYSYSQEQETAWEEKTRVRSMEEARAASGGFYIQNDAIGGAAKSSSTINVFDEIERAKKFRDDGTISDAEFEEMKSKILSRNY